MATAVETFKNFFGVLTNYAQDNTQIGRIALDNAVRQSTMYSSLDEAVGKLKDMLSDTEKYPDSDTRLKEATGMVIGAEGNLNVDTGALSGKNAGGSRLLKTLSQSSPKTATCQPQLCPSPVQPLR